MENEFGFDRSGDFYAFDKQIKRKFGIGHRRPTAVPLDPKGGAESAVGLHFRPHFSLLFNFSKANKVRI